MTIVLIILLLLIMITARPKKYNENYLDKKNTDAIKGIFLVFVFISHFISYKVALQNNWIDSIGVYIIKKTGQLMVALFLFYSGYGVMESIKRKGDDYINAFPKKRILTTLINFDIAVLIYMFAVRYFVIHPFSIKKLVLSLIGWDSFGNSNWYIFSILVLYIITYLSAKAFKNKHERVISIFVGTVLFTIVMQIYKETYWYNTVFCFVLGTFFSTYKEEIERWLSGKDIVLIIYMTIAFLLLNKLKGNIYWYYIYTVLFTSIIILLTRKISINNIVLSWIGKNLFPLYIFQRLPMILLKDNSFMKENTYVFFITCLILTLIMTLIYNFVMFLKKKIKEKMENEKNISNNSNVL